MTNMRKIIASIDRMNESTAKAVDKPIVKEGSMLKALNMVSKSVAPAAELAKEFKMFKESASGTDMTGCKCSKCGKGTYQETSQLDDMDGKLHCTNCGKEVSRWQQGVAEDKGPCWKSHKQVGMKTKGGKQVPNCVPKESVEGTNEAIHGGIGDVDHMRGAVYRNGQGMTTPCKLCNGNRHVWTNSDKGKTPNHPWINPNSATVKSAMIKCPHCKGVGVEPKGINEDAGEENTTLVVVNLNRPGYIVKKINGSSFAGAKRLGIDWIHQQADPDKYAVQFNDDSDRIIYPSFSEGIGDTIKRGVKSVKRGMQGWGNQGMKNMTDKETPRDLVNRNKGYDDEKVKSLSKFRKAVDQERPAPAHSPQALQNRVLDREMKKRGLGEGPAFDKNMNDRARAMLPKLKQGQGMFGVFQRGGSIGDKNDKPMKTFDSKEEAMAYCTRINKQLSPGERQHYGIKYVVRNVGAKQVKEADLPTAQPTATAKMNPGGASPTPATGAPTSPASSAPTAPGQKPGAAPKLDPKVAALQKQTMQKNLATMKVDTNQHTQDMQMPVSTADKDKMIGTMSPLLQNPAAAKELQNLTNKYKLPGQQQ